MCLSPQSVMLGYVVTLKPSASFYFCFFCGHVLYFYNKGEYMKILEWLGLTKKVEKPVEKKKITKKKKKKVVKKKKKAKK